MDKTQPKYITSTQLRKLREYIEKNLIIEDVFRYSVDINASHSRSLDTLDVELEDSFTERLLRLIDDKGYTDSEIYKRANIDRRHFSKIRSDLDYVPKKSTVLSFAIALNLSLDETEDLLNTAGFTLSSSVKRDVIIKFFIEQKEYNLFKINEALYIENQKPLNTPN